MSKVGEIGILGPARAREDSAVEQESKASLLLAIPSRSSSRHCTRKSRPAVGKLLRSVVGATASPNRVHQEQSLKGVMIRTIRVDGQVCRGLIDTGCSRTLLSPKIKINPDQICSQSGGIILSFRGQTVPHEAGIQLAGKPWN